MGHSPTSEHLRTQWQPLQTPALTVRQFRSGKHLRNKIGSHKAGKKHLKQANTNLHTTNKQTNQQKYQVTRRASRQATTKHQLMHNKQAIKSKQIISYTQANKQKIIKSHDKQTPRKHQLMHKQTNKQTNKQTHTPSYTKQANTTDAQTNTQQERPTVEVKENFAVVK